MKRSLAIALIVMFAGTVFAQDAIQVGEKYKGNGIFGTIVAGSETSFKYNATASELGYMVIDPAGTVVLRFYPKHNTEVSVSYKDKTVSYTNKDEEAKVFDLTGFKEVALVRCEGLN